MMKKINKKALSIAVVGVAAIGVLAVSSFGKAPQNLVQVTSLNKGELINSINISGTVKSDEAQSVYAKESLLVKEIKVEEGDVVKKGDVLAILDTESLEKDLEKAKINLASTLKSKEDSDNTIQTTIESAENALKSAKLTLEKQTLNYETTKKEYESGTSTEIISAKAALESAEVALKTSENDYKNAKQLFELEYIAKSEYETYESTYENAVISYSKATESYNKAKENLEESYKQAGIDLQTAKNNYEAAQIKVNEAKQKNTEASTYTIEQQKLEISKLEDRINNGIITAPIDGTITANNIKEGQVPSGIAFEIENIDQLVVTTYIKEYDIANVAIGQEVTIKSDATQDDVMKGVVSYIAPTTRKDSSDSEFEVEVSITDADTRLKVGMEARMNIIQAKKSDAFYVAYDTVSANQEGEDVVYTVADGIIQEVVVQTGIESDVYIEIQGDKLYEGMPIIEDPTGHAPGDEVEVEAE